MVLGIGGQFLIIKKSYNRCLWTVIYYIYTVCITKRGLVTVWLFHFCKILVHECSTWIFGRHSQTCWNCLKYIEYYEMIPIFNVFHLFSSLQLANQVYALIDFTDFLTPRKGFRTLVRVSFHALPIALQLSTK